ncbi:MAG TPA: hypothetical protein VK489_02270 [Ferruginibacter sp.]|nr:hypothetical protein [Ferruginibacter sp.]
MARAIFSWLFIILVHFFFNNSLLSQLQQPPLIYPGSDNSFWLLHMLNIPQFLLQHCWAALIFDILLTCSCIICIIIPQQRVFTWITVAGTWILYIAYCSAAGKHYAQIGYLLAPIPFLALSMKRFDMLWELVRYWVCFLYVCAGIYKLWYGGFIYSDNMSHILVQDNAEWFVFTRSGPAYGLYQYLVENPGISQWFYRIATFFDLAMLVGFFTKRYDKWLLAGLVLFHLGNFLLLHISFVEQSLIFAPFLPWRRWANHFQTNTSDD